MHVRVCACLCVCARSISRKETILKRKTEVNPPPLLTLALAAGEFWGALLADGAADVLFTGFNAIYDDGVTSHTSNEKQVLK